MKGFTNSLESAFNFFLFSSLYISCVTVVMVFQTRFYLGLQLNFTGYAGFAFFATVCSYNFHWWLTPVSTGESIRVQWTHDHRNLHLVFIFLGGLGAAYYGFFLLSYWPWVLVAILLTFLYSAPKLPFPAFAWLRKIAIGKTIFLSFVWTYVTTVLPIAVSGSPFGANEILFSFSRFFLIYPICILFDYRDRENDKREGIRSMITYFGESGITRLYYGSVFIYFICIFLLLRNGFTLIELANLSLPGWVLTIIYPYSRRNFSDYHFYFFLDGLMMLSALLSLIFRI